MSEQDNEVLEATNSNEELELENEELEEGSDDVEALREQINEKETFAKQAIARAKKAEAELKALKGKKPAEASQLNNTDSQSTIEETVLRAQGMSEELVDKLKMIAQVTGKTLIQAQSDPYFVSVKTAMEEEAKSAQAKLHTSRGSGSVKQEKDFNTPNLTEEEFKAMWKEKMNK